MLDRSLFNKAGFEEMLKLLKSRKGAISSEQLFFKRRATFFVQDLKKRLQHGAAVEGGLAPYLMPLLERMHYQNEVAQMMPPQTERAIAALDEVSKTYVVGSGKNPAKEMHWMAAQALLIGARVSGMDCCVVWVFDFISRCMYVRVRWYVMYICIMCLLVPVLVY